MPRRLNIKGGKTRRGALTLRRFAVQAECCVYIALAGKRVKYGEQFSRILYIGTTMRGVDRIAESVAFHAREMLRLHGVKHIEVFTYTCRPRQRIKTWKKLERLLILTFRDRFGVPPRFNTQGKNMQWRGEEKLFSIRRARAIINRYSWPKEETQKRF